MQKRDYFERMIEQVAAAAAKVMGLAAERRVEDAGVELDEAWRAGPGLGRNDAARLDDATLSILLGPKTILAAALFEAEAAIADARGEATRARDLRARAAASRG